MVKQLRYAHSAVIFKRITILSLWIFRLLTPQNLKTAIAFPWLLPLFSQNTGKKHSQQYEQSQSSLLWIESCHKRKGYLFFSHRSVCLSWSDLSCFQYQHQWDRCMSACRRASRRLPWGNWQHQRFREKSIRRSLTFPSEIPIPVWRRDACQSNGSFWYNIYLFWPSVYSTWNLLLKNRQAIRCYRTACLMATQESVHRNQYVFPRLLHTHYNNKISGTHSHDLPL